MEEKIVKKKKMLLHSCCGPCSTAVLEKLRDDYDVTLFFYNPNITDKDEYLMRRDNQILVLSRDENRKIKFIEGKYEPDLFLEKVKGFEREKEGGERCRICFLLRMSKALEIAEKLGADEFSTTLSVSPHKRIDVIRDIGNRLEEKSLVKFHDEDYKKKAGFQRSISLSKEYGLYRQNYCGCEFSKWEERK